MPKKHADYQCYRERRTGDYLVIEYKTTRDAINAGRYQQRRQHFGRSGTRHRRLRSYPVWEARAAVVLHEPASCCSCGVSSAFLFNCVKVRPEDVPGEWMQWLDPLGEMFPNHPWLKGEASAQVPHSP